jgi:hypothetical protein
MDMALCTGLQAKKSIMETGRTINRTASEFIFG